MTSSIFDFEINSIKGEKVSLRQFSSMKAGILFNAASLCGFTNQYADLQALYDKYKHLGLYVLGFPCNQFGDQEPGDNAAIGSFCSTTYQVTFPMFEKIDVKGRSAHPLFTFLSENAPGLLGTKSIKWNFTKFLVDSTGLPIKRFAPSTSPLAMEDDIKQLLNI